MQRNEMVGAVGLLLGCVFMAVSMLYPDHAQAEHPLYNGSVYASIGTLMCIGTLRECHWPLPEMLSGGTKFCLGMFAPFIVWACMPATIEVVMLCIGK